MSVETIQSWRELDDAVAGLGGGGAHAPWVFRGLARSSYSNVASLARLGDGFPALERHLIRNFRKYAHRERPGPTLWDWLSLAQHHGLPTRLLDWTFSPFVAAHFATATSPDHEAIVLDGRLRGGQRGAARRAARVARGRGRARVHDRAARRARADARHARGARRRATRSRCSSSRPRSTTGSSTSRRCCRRSPTRGTTWTTGSTPIRDAWHAWRIPPAAKAEIRERLDQGNVTERVLMPGLDGLAAWLRRYYAPGRGGGGESAMDGGGAMSGPLPSGTSQGEAQTRRRPDPPRARRGCLPGGPKASRRRRRARGRGSRVRRELLEHPLGAELRAPVRAPVDEHVVARAQVHREVALDRVPLVVRRISSLSSSKRQRAANALQRRANAGVLAALLAQRPVGALEPAPLAA